MQFAAPESTRIILIKLYHLKSVRAVRGAYRLSPRMYSVNIRGLFLDNFVLLYLLRYSKIKTLVLVHSDTKRKT